MSMYARRLQVLLDADRHERLRAEAARRHVSVATLVREAIDCAFPTTTEERRAAGERILAAEPMAVPSPPELRSELDALRGRSG